MAAGKEKEATATPSARPHGVAVRSCGLKKRTGGKRLLCRVPLQDITNLLTASSAAAELEDPDQVTKLDAVLKPSMAVRDAVAGGVAAKAARYSLRKGFR